jgi:hypothetical protein
MSELIRISAKDLGAVALDDFCERCFWIKRKAPRGIPFQIFPGIFSSIDAYSKRVIHGWFDKHGTCPPWLADLGELKGYINPPHYSKFYIVDPETNILLTGSPDGVYVRADDSRLIVDYKTSKYTGTQDGLFPMYEIQLNVYALIGQSWGLAPITGLALIYTEPVTDENTAAQDTIHHDGGFSMPFTARVLNVDLDLGKIRPLLARVRDILDRPSAPTGRNGCKDCGCLNDLIALAQI